MDKEERKKNKANVHAFVEFTRPMEILSGLDDKQIRDIRAHISITARDAFLAGYEEAIKDNAIPEAIRGE